MKQLSDVLREVGARPTFDRRRTTQDPCYVCGAVHRLRRLVTIGTYTRRIGGNIQPGDRIERPMCAPCEELTA